LPEEIAYEDLNVHKTWRRKGGDGLPSFPRRAGPNENRLNLADADARKYLKAQTEKYFFGEGADQAQGYVPEK
jgi:hypothetical protein